MTLLPTTRASEPNRTREDFTPCLSDVIENRPQLPLKNKVALRYEQPDGVLLPTPTVFHVGMHDEPIETFEARQAKSSTGQIGMSLGVALRYEQPHGVLLRSPKASEASGGALGEAEALRRGNTVGVRDQVLDLVASQGLKVSRKERNESDTDTNN